ncbi:hypothetical protein [Chromobacterium violaceum]|nr:hypothetical protein [Chromobacterium violaceum]
MKDVTVPDYDEKISASIKTAEFDGGGYDMIIAIENQQGQVYRIIATDGLAEYMKAIGKFQKLGMTDRLENVLNSKDGYDSRFHF